MRTVEQRVSPQAFARIKERLMLAEILGYGPAECVARALWSVGLGPNAWPPEPCETVLIVDHTLQSVIYPFMTRCEADDIQMQGD